MEKRKIEISLDTAREWYLQGGNLKEVALQAFTEDELKERKVKVWEDLLGEKIGGYFISGYSAIKRADYYRIFTETEKNVFLCERQAKSALAMAQISQLLPYYNTKWENGIPDWSEDNYKVIINPWSTNDIIFNTSRCIGNFLAFETEEIAKKFYKNNRQLVKDYLMID